MEEIQKIADKIRKLLAKANGTENQDEAAVFAAKAHELMVKHGIEMSEVEKKEEKREGVVTEPFTFKINYPWSRQLAFAVADYYMCGFFTFKGTDVFVFVGRPSRTVVARMMFEYLFKTVRRLASRYAPPGPIRNAFERGANFRLADRLRAMKRAAAADVKSGLPVMYDEAAAELRDIFANMKVKKCRMNTGVGFNAGMQAANGINLSEQITTAAKPASPSDLARTSHLMIEKAKNRLTHG